MWQKNSGKGESNVLQNQFTRYLAKAIYRDKKKHLRKKLRIENCELYAEENRIRLSGNVIHQIVDIIALEQALGEIKERDRYIFLERILEKRGFDDLADELGLGYKGVAAAYYRVLQKLREALGGE